MLPELSCLPCYALKRQPKLDMATKRLLRQLLIYFRLKIEGNIEHLGPT